MRLDLMSECLERVLIDIRQFQPIVPIGIAVNHLLMQLVQALKSTVVQRARHHDDQINIADFGVEVAGNQRTVQIDTYDIVAQYGVHAIDEPIKQRLY